MSNAMQIDNSDEDREQVDLLRKELKTKLGEIQNGILTINKPIGNIGIYLLELQTMDISKEEFYLMLESLKETYRLLKESSGDGFNEGIGEDNINRYNQAVSIITPVLGNIQQRILLKQTVPSQAASTSQIKDKTMLEVTEISKKSLESKISFVFNSSDIKVNKLTQPREKEFIIDLKTSIYGIIKFIKSNEDFERIERLVEKLEDVKRKSSTGNFFTKSGENDLYLSDEFKNVLKNYSLYTL